jgi:hypothetical protein
LRPSGFPYGGEVSEELPPLVSRAPPGLRGSRRCRSQLSGPTPAEPHDLEHWALPVGERPIRRSVLF